MTAAALAPPHPQAAPAARVLSYGRYEDLVACAVCGEPYRRTKGAAYAACLGCQIARRLADAGISPDDPVLRSWAAWNAAVTRGRRP